MDGDGDDGAELSGDDDSGGVFVAVVVDLSELFIDSFALPLPLTLPLVLLSLVALLFSRFSRSSSSSKFLVDDDGDDEDEADDAFSLGDADDGGDAWC